MRFNRPCLLHRCAAVFFGLALLLTLAVPAFAEPMTGDLMYLSERRNMSIRVSYTDDGSGTMPELGFVDPYGQELYYGQVDETLLSAVFLPEEQLIYYMIPNAAPGQWYLIYDSSFSGRLEVDYAPYTRELLIESFSLLQIDGDYADVSFLTGFDDETYYDYKIHAVTVDAQGNVSGSKELCSGYGYTNELAFVQVPLYDLASYDSYRLQLQVSVRDNGFLINDTALSDGFSYTSGGMLDPLGDYYITFDRTTGQLLVDWGNVATWRADSYVLGVFTNLSGNEPAFNNNYTADETAATVLLEPDLTEIRVELTYMDGSKVSQTNAKTFDPAYVTLNFTTTDNTASAQAPLEYAVPGSDPVQLMILVNQQEAVYRDISGAGTLPVQLEEDLNSIILAYKIDSYITIRQSAEINSDRRAPTLSFFENMDGITVDGNVFQLVGMTETGATLSVNGKQVQINEDGSFGVELNLTAPGANAFEIVAADAVGNLTRRSVVLFRASEPVQTLPEQASLLDYISLILAVLISMLLVALILVLSRRGDAPLSKKQVFWRCTIGGWILTGMGLIASLVLLIIQSTAGSDLDGEAFFDAVMESVEKAYELLMDFQRYGSYLTILLIISGVLAAISLALTVVALVLPKNDGPKEPKQPKAPRPPKEPKPPKPKKEKAPKPVKPAPAPVQSTPAAPVQPAPAVSSEPVQPAPATPAPVPAAPAEPAPAEKKPPVAMFCTNCGAPRTPGALFCEECGHRFE